MVVNNPINRCIIQPKKLHTILDVQNTKIIDCRWYLDDKSKGFREFQKGHIKGASFFDIEKISDHTIKTPHMFPRIEQFLSFAENCGISHNDKVIIYDQVGFFCSARVWLMFKYFGFKNLKILNGGLQSWKKHKFPLIKKFFTANKVKLNLKKSSTNLTISKNEILEDLNHKNNFKIIDARPENRFLGLKNEPRPNLKKGNIKNSINIPFDKITNKDGKLKSLKYLRDLVFNEKKLKKKNIIICYCGSGITACNIIFVLNILGYKKVKLYDGSWAEWGKKKSNQN